MALAVRSKFAMQAVSQSCSKSSTPIRMIGWNGQELPIREYSWTINYTLDIETNCEVIASCSPTQQLTDPPLSHR